MTGRAAQTHPGSRLQQRQEPFKVYQPSYRCAWLICEATSRWVSAIRMAVARDPRCADRPLQLREFRGLADTTDALKSAPDSFLTVEVGRSNLAAVLNWLPEMQAAFPACHAVAALEGEERLSEPLHSLLLEMGFLCVAQSPRAVRELLDLYHRHTKLAASRQRKMLACQSKFEQVWAQLPWQALEPPVG